MPLHPALLSPRGDRRCDVFWLAAARDARCTGAGAGTCILQSEDVPEDYEIDTAFHETTNEDIIARSASPNMAAVITSTGRITGFEVIYSQPSLDALTYGPIAIQSWKTLFENPDGAHAVLDASARGEILQTTGMARSPSPGKPRHRWE